MFCKNCGRQIPDEAAFCPACGTKRSGGDTYGSERSGRDIKDLPNYAKENDLYRSGSAVDSNRKKFSLSDSGQKKFSLSDSGQKKFSLSNQGSDPKKFSLSGKDDGGIVRISASREPAPPPKEPTGFVNPLKDSGKTVFHDAPAGNTAGTAAASGMSAKPAASGPEASAAPEQSAPQAEKVDAVVLEKTDGDTGSAGGDTGFVNPLRDSGQEIHWGSDGDRNETKKDGFAGDPSEIDSHMGLAIFSTLCCCIPTGIVAIVFASQVSKHIQNGDYEAAKKSADHAQMFCWISIILGLFCNVGSSIFSTLSDILNN